MANDNQPVCELCGEPMPEGEEMFKFHGYSGNCPKPPLPRVVFRVKHMAALGAGHVYCRVFSAPDKNQTYAALGNLTIRKGQEWDAFQRAFSGAEFIEEDLSRGDDHWRPARTGGCAMTGEPTQDAVEAFRKAFYVTGGTVEAGLTAAYAIDRPQDYEIAHLTFCLNSRDDFLGKIGQWQAYVDTLPDSSIAESPSVRGQPAPATTKCPRCHYYIAHDGGEGCHEKDCYYSTRPVRYSKPQDRTVAPALVDPPQGALPSDPQPAVEGESAAGPITTDEILSAAFGPTPPLGHDPRDDFSAANDPFASPPPGIGREGDDAGGDNRMTQIDKFIEELQSIKEQWGNTCIYIRRNGLSWGAVALNYKAEDEKHGVFDLQASHDRDIEAYAGQVKRLMADRDQWRTKALASPSPQARTEDEIRREAIEMCAQEMDRLAVVCTGARSTYERIEAYKAAAAALRALPQPQAEGGER